MYSYSPVPVCLPLLLFASTSVLPDHRSYGVIKACHCVIKALAQNTHNSREQRYWQHVSSMALRHCTAVMRSWMMCEFRSTRKLIDQKTRCQNSAKFYEISDVPSLTTAICRDTRLFKSFFIIFFFYPYSSSSSYYYYFIYNYCLSLLVHKWGVGHGLTPMIKINVTPRCHANNDSLLRGELF